MHTVLKDPKTGAEQKVVIDADDGIRGDASVEGLSKLRAVFKKDGTTTAGNSSQVGGWLTASVSCTERRSFLFASKHLMQSQKNVCMCRAGLLAVWCDV